MTRRTYTSPDAYDDYGYDERQESASASEDGPRRFVEIATWRDASAWGGRDE